jgi:hypothetical protein
MRVSTNSEPERRVLARERPIDASGETSAVSWGAIAAGAFATAALVLALTLAAAGLGLSAISPWKDLGPSAPTIGLAGAIALVLVHVVSSGTGGFVAGRLRTKWASTPIDEVYFRDTAHGFLSWAVSTVIGIGLLAAISLLVLTSGAQVGSQAITTMSSTATAAALQPGGKSSSNADPTPYLVDMLLRGESEAPPSDDGAVRAEVGRIFMAGAASGDVSAADRTYLARVVASRTSLAQPEAEKRVAEIIRRAKDAKAKAEEDLRQAADTARKSAAYLSLWTFVAMLAGAFTSSYAATIGGRIRDD